MTLHSTPTLLSHFLQLLRFSQERFGVPNLFEFKHRTLAKLYKKDPFTMGASHMTLSHNSLIRGFNSIYQQAPRISASDYKDFTGYCLAWHRCVEQHHMHEEVNYFPEIERMTGQKGVMDGEVEQHGMRSHENNIGSC